MVELGGAEPLSQGAGLISASEAVDYALRHHGKLGQETYPLVAS